jgi:hypothetical protein
MKQYLLASDFDHTLSFNDSGLILSELLGIPDFDQRIAGLANIHLVQQGAELAYLLLHDPEYRRVRKEDLVAVVEGHARMRGGIDPTIEFDGFTEPYDAPLDSVVVRAFQRSILKTLNTRPVLTHKTGTGDMNTLAERMGIPCVTYGPADSNLGHTENEFVLDFAFIQPSNGRAKVRSRVVSSPRHTKRLLLALQKNLERYEERFGRIELCPDEEPMLH